MDMNNQKPQSGGWKENGEFINFMLDFQHEIMHYESAAKCVTMRLEIADTEFRTKVWRPLIHTISHRIHILNIVAYHPDSCNVVQIITDGGRIS